jgi:hypothetical protein
VLTGLAGAFTLPATRLQTNLEKYPQGEISTSRSVLIDASSPDVRFRGV